MALKAKKDFFVYIGIILFAVLFIYFGNKYAADDLTIFEQSGDYVTVQAKITNILEVVEDTTGWVDITYIVFEAEATSGEFKNQVFQAEQTIDDYYMGLEKEVTVGDKVILIEIDDGIWYFMDYVRIDTMFYLCCVFVVLLLVFGRMKGVNALLSLGLTCSAIFAVFIPSILSGKNIYVSAIVVCVYSVVVTLFLLNGINKKSFAAASGCFGGITAASLLTLFMNKALLLTGMADHDSRYLLFLPTENPIDLKAIIFAGIIIGAVGAVMDVAVSISSALWELKEQAPDLSVNKLFKSGINIGKDIMGSMTNTLVLAYIGSSLTIILILIVYANSFIELLNRELVIVEILQAVVGSMGILLTMPLTALICALLFSKNQNKI